MRRKELLLQRLDEIGLSLERAGGALLLLGVGSVNPRMALEIRRLAQADGSNGVE